MKWLSSNALSTRAETGARCLDRECSCAAIAVSALLFKLLSSVQLVKLRRFPATAFYRRRLVDAALIEAPSYGMVSFAIPYMREYLIEHVRE